MASSRDSHRRHPSSQRGKVYDETDQRDPSAPLPDEPYYPPGNLIGYLFDYIHRLPLPVGRRKRRPGKLF
ncbi:MAG TPA: hypothetical protein VKU85_14380 [bacterium]|nr:hypothetical protein [bacterium]